ncbi:hypothetical protein EON68_03230, partial [archaeon]
MEVGAGHGRLSFLILAELMKAREMWPGAPADGLPPFRWIISDFSSANFDFWMSHERLRPFFEAGICLAATFDATRDNVLTLSDGRRLQPGSLRNPIVAIANYVFDTLYQDAFRIVEGQLQQAYVATYSASAQRGILDVAAAEEAQRAAAGASETTQVPPPQVAPAERDDTAESSQAANDAAGDAVGDAAAAAAADDIANMRLVWEYRLCDPTSVYDDVHMQAVLRVYAARLRNASLLIPAGGIRALDTLAALAGGRILMLCGDKAHNHEEELTSIRDPHVAVHGSFSMMVNFHAVRLFALAKGGFALHTPHLEGFKCSAFVLGLGGPADSVPPPEAGSA